MALNIQNALHGTDEMEDEVNQTIESLDYANKRMKRKSYRRYSRAIRTQAEEDEERQKILMEALHGGNTKKAAQTDKDNEMRKAEAIKIALAKAKQLAARAFKEDIIDQLSMAVEQQPIFHAGTMLDASARVYSFRVDVTHSEACDVRMKLGDPTTSNKANEGGKHQADEKHGHGSEGSDMDTDIDASSDDGPTTQKQATDKEDRKKRGLKDGANRLEEDSDIEADEEHTPANLDDLEDFDDLEATEESDPENEDILMEPEQLMEKFRKKADSAHAKCMKRRNKVSMVTTDTNELDDREETAQMCAHLYSKATHNFDEGSTSGLLMQNITIGKHGRRLLLHNDVKCPPDPPSEKVNADDLLPFYGLMNDIEKAEPPPSATIFGDDDASTSLMVDPTTQYDETQAFLGADGNATFAVEPSLTVPAHCALLKTIKESMKKNVPRSPKDFLFFNRLRLQRKLGITSGKFMKILSSVKEVEPALYSSLVHAMFTIPQRSKIHADSSRRSIDSQNWIGNAVIADE
ncbi:unnamed protein product, partial [Anisakis simplex]|uniref:Condensin complex subunit 2 n=1 Tax=Anisakis simplex TaxID=6269 RepID=A0A0M3KDH0_ANISI